MVIGALTVDDLITIQEIARLRLGLEVNIHRMTTQAWLSKEHDPFLDRVASRPIVPLLRRDVIDA